MVITAKLNNLRISARKVRLVADLIRRKSVEEAQSILNFTVKRGSPVLFKLLEQAIANAKNNFKLDEAGLYISKITVDDGVKLRRWRPRARGSANLIQKKTCHVTLILDSRQPLEKIEKHGTNFKKEKIETAEKEINMQKPEAKKEKPKFKTEKSKSESLKRVEQGTKRIFQRKTF